MRALGGCTVNGMLAVSFYILIFSDVLYNPSLLSFFFFHVLLVGMHIMDMLSLLLRHVE